MIPPREQAPDIPQNSGYISSVTLVVLGGDLAPESISRSLGMRPDQAWAKGEPRRSGAPHQWGAWKKCMPDSLKDSSLEEQLLYWANQLLPLKSQLRELTESGQQVALDCFVKQWNRKTKAADVEVSPELLELLTDIGVELQLSFDD